MKQPLGSLTNRIFVASTLLATLSIAAAVYFVSARVTREAEVELQRDLAEAASLVDQQQTTLFDGYQRTALLIADLPRFKAGLSTRDAPTVQPIAADYQQLAGVDVLLVTDRDGAVLAAVGGPAALVDRLEEAPAVRQALDGRTAHAFWPHPRGILQLVSVPVTLGLERPEILGTLSMGYLLDDERAAAFKAVTGTDVAFALGGQVRSSTLGAASHGDLAPLLGADRLPRLSVGGSDYAALVQPLASPITPAGTEVPRALVLRSRTERMQALSDIQTALGGLALLAVILAAVVAYGVARTITRPLATLTDHMRQIASTGDLTRQVDLRGTGGWNDEDARLLATTFNALTESVSRFQREAAQRERLSSLGRLSTVIAHEVRNPLMIIKGALRQMGRPGAGEADVRDAAADIDEETDRLNRLVNDVLDFARPIRVERTPTDVNAVCQDAVGAVLAAEPEPPVRLDLDPSVGSLETDGERIRTALVNLLANARQAVVEANGRGPARRDAVTLETRAAGPRHVTITIRDRGVGMGADDLRHIFDPYFTTRRTGTGLGLPIAKNIVEGLGGVIAVSSRPGEGTDVRIELGDAPAPR